MKQTEHSFDNTERGRLLFSPGMKLADLVESNYELLVVLARMGIPLGFGESSVGEVCRQRGISAELFLMICRIYSSEVPVLPYEQLTSDDLGGVLDYLHTSHLYYLEVTLPHLDAKMAAMTATCDGVHSKILSTFFADYRREVDNHSITRSEPCFLTCRLCSKNVGWTVTISSVSKIIIAISTGSCAI